MSDEARSTPDLTAADEERPSGLPDQKSAARLRTPLPEAPKGARSDETPSHLRVLRPPGRDAEVPPAPESPPASEAPVERPPGLQQMTTSARLRLQLVFDEDDKPRIESTPPPPDPKKPPSVSSAKLPAFDPRDLGALRSLGRWIGVCGLMTLTVGALTGLSWFTGEGKVANVVVGILATALAVWLLAASVAFHRVANQKGKVSHQLVSGFTLLRSAFLLKAVLLFAAMALGCFTFSLATSLLLLL